MSPYCSPYCSPICTPSGTPVGTPLASPYNSPYSTPVCSPKPTRHSILHSEELVTPAIETLNLNTSITKLRSFHFNFLKNSGRISISLDTKNIYTHTFYRLLKKKKSCLLYGYPAVW